MSVTTGAIGGLALAGATIGLALILPVGQALVLLAVLLGLIGGVYMGFGAMGGSVAMFLTESVAALAFVALAATAPFTEHGIGLLAVGYILHGLWDVAHHPGPLIGAPHWYVGGCAAYDWVVGAFILLAFP